MLPIGSAFGDSVAELGHDLVLSAIPGYYRVTIELIAFENGIHYYRFAAVGNLNVGAVLQALDLHTWGIIA